MQHWQLQEAKNKFSAVIEKALSDGPQIVTRRGVETVVILSAEKYRELIKPKIGLVDFMQRSPLKGVDLDLDRDKDYSRDIDL
jgi:prevent-host-death family protein